LITPILQNLKKSCLTLTLTNYVITNCKPCGAVVTTQMFFFCTRASLKEIGIDVGMANSVMAEEEIVHPKKIRDFLNPLFNVY
jgi:hypothetical protein